MLLDIQKYEPINPMHRKSPEIFQVKPWIHEDILHRLFVDQENAYLQPTPLYENTKVIFRV